MDMEPKSSTHMFSKDYEDNTYSNLASKKRPYIDESKRTILKCLEDILDKRQDENLDSGKAVTIADFGTADGASSIPLLNKMIGLSNKKFGSLNLDDHVHVAAIGRNMYGRCLPPASIDIGFSSVALHWLSQLPCNIEKGFSLFDATCSNEEKTRFAARAREDWKRFVINRGKELKQGGYFICLIPSVDADDEASTILKIYSEVLVNMKKEKFITAEEYVKITLCVYPSRTVDDFMEPFTARDPVITALGLQMTSYCKKEFMRSDSITEKTVMADNAYRTVFRNTIYRGLSEERSHENKEKICTQIFHQVSEIIKTRTVALPMHCMEVVIYRQ